MIEHIVSPGHEDRTLYGCPACERPCEIDCPERDTSCVGDHPDSHANGCPGLGKCDKAWHDGGCEEFWQYCDASGFDITGDPLAERDATEKRLWQGPDGPSEVYTRATPCNRNGGPREWERQS